MDNEQPDPGIEKPIHSTIKMPVGKVNVHIVPKNGKAVDLAINQKNAHAERLQGRAQDAAFAVITAAAKERFGDRVESTPGSGWAGPHHITINFTAKDKETGQDLPPITADDVKNMLSELNAEFPRRAAIHRAAREAGEPKGRA